MKKDLILMMVICIVFIVALLGIKVAVKNNPLNKHEICEEQDVRNVYYIYGWLYAKGIMDHCPNIGNNVNKDIDGIIERYEIRGYNNIHKWVILYKEKAVKK